MTAPSAAVTADGGLGGSLDALRGGAVLSFVAGLHRRGGDVAAVATTGTTEHEAPHADACGAS